MFLNTLGIGKKTVETTLKKIEKGFWNVEDRRGKYLKRLKRKLDAKTATKRS